MDIKCQSSVDSINVQDGVDATVQIDDPTSKFVSANNLNLKDKLSNIRHKLVQNGEVKMNHTFSFTNKINNNDNKVCFYISPRHKPNGFAEEALKNVDVDVLTLKDYVEMLII
ncbi:unnamed protein product [Rhizophagus irregularis]|uniref:Uncharacterized protein n=1 Tax=Rhizophagus irregularis TaxID=588596 RepID=A0A2I1HD77_9GLOM|nr:hypothetical protein RhiirA4_477428 [Rhizophagus irregularis]CAB4445882.1 unnamed protein product [Rhizophagus irregularis]